MWIKWGKQLVKELLALTNTLYLFSKRTIRSKNWDKDKDKRFFLSNGNRLCFLNPSYNHRCRHWILFFEMYVSHLFSALTQSAHIIIIRTSEIRQNLPELKSSYFACTVLSGISEFVYP